MGRRCINSPKQKAHAEFLEPEDCWPHRGSVTWTGRPPQLHPQALGSCGLWLARPLSAEGSICFVLLLKQLPTHSHSSAQPRIQDIPQGYMERSGKVFCTTKPMLVLWWFQEAEDTVSSLGMFVSGAVWWSGWGLICVCRTGLVTFWGVARVSHSRHYAEWLPVTVPFPSWGISKQKAAHAAPQYAGRWGRWVTNRSHRPGDWGCLWGAVGGGAGLAAWSPPLLVPREAHPGFPHALSPPRAGWETPEALAQG